MKRPMLLSALCLLLSLPGCGPGEEPAGLPGDTVSEVQQATSYTGATSEELPPIHCGGTSVAMGLGCGGFNCDNVSLVCDSIPRNSGYANVTWTQPFSEETVNPTLCPTGSWVTGASCSGGYCDNVSLECTYLTGRTVGDCGWSDWISDETSIWRAPAGYFIRGAKCRGWWCDDISVYYCKML
jgi:hypothetical protein